MNRMGKHNILLAGLLSSTLLVLAVLKLAWIAEVGLDLIRGPYAIAALLELVLAASIVTGRGLTVALELGMAAVGGMALGTTYSFLMSTCPVQCNCLGATTLRPEVALIAQGVLFTLLAVLHWRGATVSQRRRVDEGPSPPA